MKNLIPVIMIVMLLTSCSDGGKSAEPTKSPEPTVNTTPDAPPIVIDDETPDTPDTPETPDTPDTPDAPETPIGSPFTPVTKQSMFAFYGNEKLYLYDGDIVRVTARGSINHAGGNNLIISDVLYTIDDYGNVIYSKNLSETPDISYDNGKTWGVYVIEYQTVNHLPLPYVCDYTLLVCDGVEVGSWIDRNYTVKSIHSDGDDIFLLDTTGKYRHVNGTRDVHLISDNLIIENFNTVTRTATLNGVNVFWQTNHFNNARTWTNADGVWYSANGYVFDGTTLHETNNALTKFRTMSTAPIEGLLGHPYVVSAGYRIENGDVVLYYFECNSGWLFSFNPRLDTTTLESPVYIGDMTRSGGIIHASFLNPVMSRNGNFMIFGFSNGTTYEFDFIHGWVRTLGINPDYMIKF